MMKSYLLLDSILGTTFMFFLQVDDIITIITIIITIIIIIIIIVVIIIVITLIFDPPTHQHSHRSS